MKKYFYILAALSLSPQFSIAQDLGVDLDAELDQVVAQQRQSGLQQQSAALPTTTVGASSVPVAVNGQPVYIVNQAQTAAVQKQPVTYIEDSPVTQSRSEQIRRARQDAEIETEQRIVEKLEQSRMEDEKRRAGVLFGDKFNNMQGAAPEAQQYAQPQMAAPVAQPIIIQQAPQVVAEDNTRDVVREEIRAALDSEKELPVAPVETRYFSAYAGVSEYPDVSNVQGNVSLGASFGTKYDDVMAIEGAFTYGNYTLNPNYYNSVDVKQYSGSLTGKYLFFSGIFRPILGGVLQYSYREFAYENSGYGSYYYGNNYGYNSYYPYNTGSSNSDSWNSHALDVGIVTGADLEFNARFALGFDFRYMYNLANRLSNNLRYVNNSAALEKLEYYTMSVVGRVNF